MIDRAPTAKDGSTSDMPTGNQISRRASRAARALLAVAILVIAWPGPQAPAKDAGRPRNLTQLVAEAGLIVAAKVIRVTDGIDAQGVPYTEVTLDVAACPKGGLAAGERSSFRQYGLVAPRRLSSGRMLNAVSPKEFPRWHEGEQVVAFVQPPARRTGLQSTVGLGQGKFSVVDGRVVNGLGNRGLFAGVQVADGLLDARERAMFDSRGPVDAATFVRLVDRAVREDWIGTGRLR